MTTTHPSANDSGLNLDHLEALARAATPGRWMRLFGERTVYDRMEDGCRGNAIVRADLGYGLQDISNLDFIAAANPAAVLELIALARRAVLANQPAPTVPAGRALADAVLRDVCELVYTEDFHHEKMLSVTIDDLRLIVSRNAAALAHQPAQEQAEPVAWMNPHETFAPDAFLWKYDAGHPLYSVPVYRAAQQEPVAALGSIGDLTEFHVLLNWYDNEASYGSINEGRDKLTKYIDKWADRRAAQLDGGQEGSAT